MGAFRTALRPTEGVEVDRWCYVHVDQVHLDLGPWRPMDGESRERIGLVLVETSWKARQRPYHQQKLALLLTNLRHFALEAQAAGHPVRVLHDERPYEAVLAEVADEVGPLHAMRWAERETREALQPLVQEGRLLLHPHTGWMTGHDLFQKAVGDRRPWRMDAFYRAARKASGVLLTDEGKPEGGKWSFDAENRLPWDGAVPLPDVPRFPPDAITAEVVDLVRTRYSHHPGRVTPDDLPASAADARRAWAWALEEAMPWFGPYEDAMTCEHRSLFHTRIAALLNLSRLLPAEVVADVEAADLPLNSREGFIRQVLGWREFVRHVHEATDGLRDGVQVAFSTDARPGAGWSGDWAAPAPAVDALGANLPLPAAFWGTSSGMACLDQVVDAVVEDGWTHHIPRLMVLANLATLLGVRPREITDWFWAMFTDAYDWVVEPNVLGMGTYATGPLMSTKPYVCGTPYLKRMGDACGDCAFSPSSTCPVSDLYWAFMARHGALFEGNVRMAMPMRTLARRDPEKRAADARVHAAVVEVLGRGEALRPADVTAARRA
jgi:deoxyribodipyrimidine photolyase-related protein